LRPVTVLHIRATKTFSARMTNRRACHPSSRLTLSEIPNFPQAHPRTIQSPILLRDVGIGIYRTSFCGQSIHNNPIQYRMRLGLCVNRDGMLAQMCARRNRRFRRLTGWIDQVIAKHVCFLFISKVVLKIFTLGCLDIEQQQHRIIPS
jgi:hypothetical protein